MDNVDGINRDADTINRDVVRINRDADTINREVVRTSRSPVGQTLGDHSMIADRANRIPQGQIRGDHIMTVDELVKIGTMRSNWCGFNLKMICY
jgi:hypothetical protein